MSNDKPDYHGIRNRINKLRVEREMTQEQFAEATNLTSRGLSSIETGEKNAGGVTWYRIAKHLSVSLDYLVFGKRSKAILSKKSVHKRR